MKTVFVGGSRKISRVNEVIRSRLDGMIASELQVLVGDANGADKVLQRHFAEAGYRKVRVYFSGNEPRNNLGAWPERQVAPISKKKDFAFYMAKDLSMAEDADLAFMLWDGEGKGTLNNMLNLLERRKKLVVYFAPERRCIALEKMDDLKPMLEQCSAEALETFGAKIDLNARLTGGQQSLNLR